MNNSSTPKKSDLTYALPTMTNVEFREYALDDFQQVHNFASNPSVCHHQAWGPNSEEETKAYLHMAIEQQTKKPRTIFDMALVAKDLGKIIIWSVRVELRSDKEAEIGYSLHPDFWGKGFGTQAAQGPISMAKAMPGVKRIVATVEVKALAPSACWKNAA